MKCVVPWLFGSVGAVAGSSQPGQNVGVLVEASDMRSLGLPVAYVSGYLRTVQSPDEKRLEGADAMHAWALSWCGEDAGWIGLDPTNDILASHVHVVLAIGRDYADVAPIDGVIFASGAQRLATSVHVVPVG